MMKILLICPEFEAHRRYYRKKTKFYFPFSIWYLGSYLKYYDIEVELIDLSLFHHNDKTVADRCRNYKYIGISFISAQVPRARELCHIIRKINPDAKIIVGGIHPTLFPEQTLASSLVDYLVIGEGEISLLKLLRSLKSGKDINFTPEIG